MLSSLDITRVLAEAEESVLGSVISGLEFYRKERAVQIYVRKKKNYCITFSYHPGRSGFYIMPAARSRPETPEKPRPFGPEMENASVTRVRQVPHDRIVEIEIAAGKDAYRLVIEILGPNGNLWLLDRDGRMLSSLRKKNFNPGDRYRVPPLPHKLDPASLHRDDLKRLMADNPDTDIARLLEKNIYGFDFHLARIVMQNMKGKPVADTDLDTIHSKIGEITLRYKSTDFPIYAYRIRGKTVFYPLKIIGYEPLAKFRSLSEAQKEITERIEAESAEVVLRDKTLKNIAARIKKIERLIKKLDDDVTEAAGYERYLQLSDLLKINLVRLERGMASITVDDLHRDARPIEIALNPKLSGPENVKAYARRYRKGKEGLAILRRRRENISMELENLKQARSGFQDNFDQAQKKYPELVAARRPSGIKGAPAIPALPYKEYRTSTGLAILVGKSGANNERTTFEHARPYELWFHTSQCPGSHVVLKFPHKNFQPSKAEIEESAAAAAYFSKARGSGRVPVSYTLKKYVRKPRKAKPGLVLIEREKTIIVEPREPGKKSKIE